MLGHSRNGLSSSIHVLLACFILIATGPVQALQPKPRKVRSHPVASCRYHRARLASRCGLAIHFDKDSQHLHVVFQNLFSMPE
ncbi:hypothetical protein HDV63DRAFT_282979 [Trichoderma sp. SZMC 28014]